MKVLKNVYDPNKPKVKLTKKDLKKTFEWLEKSNVITIEILKQCKKTN